MKKIEIVLFMGISFIIKVLGLIIFLGIFIIGHCINKGVQQGVILTLSETLMLIVSAIFLFWISLRLMMYGEELSEKSKFNQSQS